MSETVIEIQDFYPIKDKRRPTFLGTLHVYIIHNGVEFDIRGYQCYRKGKKIGVYPPCQSAMDEGEKVIYPVWSLTDREKQKEITSKIIEQGSSFIEEKLKNAAKEPHKPYYKEGKPPFSTKNFK